ncbi:AbaSI family restriction endonuclease [Enterovibrio paralichthyis]|uniref:AbaSI family restriction endonuclease n=1 Tax=Enterovibrio paralichthyis TaxID=2853805 RepID=UPI001C480246|nr:hypothetical protein [Enterovibrio paralichthyis]MBV7297487.1 hypothetical protein [Enterovibrio paralichthyis]
MKTLHLTRQLQRCTHKRFELYAISRIIHKVDDLDVKFITQQYVLRPDGFALTDLYLPQLQLHVEIDEGFHKQQIDADKIRELDIVTVTQHEVYRIDASVSIEHINQQVDELVSLIKASVDQQKSDGVFVPWNPEFEHSIERFKALGYVDLEDDVAFRTSVEVCNLFGHNYAGFQRSSASVPGYPNHKLWFPKLYPNGEWFNELSQDGKEILEYNIESIEKRAQVIEKNLQQDITMVVFARVRNELGQTMYRFRGVFVQDREKTSAEAGSYWKRVAERIYFKSE